MTSQSINSETKTIPKLNTYKTKQRIKQITSKLFYIDEHKKISKAKCLGR